MTPILLTGPAIEPVSLQEARNWLRVDTNSDDMLIQALITSARLVIEAQAGVMLITQVWRCLFDAWPESDVVDLQLKPLQSVGIINVRDKDGAPATVPPDTFMVDPSPMNARIAFRIAPPAPGQALAGIEIDVTVGFGASESAVPATIRQAMLLLIGRWFENRGDTHGDAQELPRDIAGLLAPWRPARLA